MTISNDKIIKFLNIIQPENKWYIRYTTNGHPKGVWESNKKKGRMIKESDLKLLAFDWLDENKNDLVERYHDIPSAIFNSSDSIAEWVIDWIIDMNEDGKE